MARMMFLGAVAAAALGALPAGAATFVLGYTGNVAFQPPKFGGTVRLDETGVGQLSLDPGLSSVSLGSGLTDFSFTTDLVETDLPVAQPQRSFGAGHVTYGLADLQSLDATLSNGVITSLSFQTKSKSVFYGGGSPVSFYDFGGDGGSLLRAGGPSPQGKITVAAASSAVPEPMTWATMLIGFGAVGYGLRRRRPALRTA